MGTQKNRLNETVLLSKQNKCKDFYTDFFYSNLDLQIGDVQLPSEARGLKFNLIISLCMGEVHPLVRLT